MKIICFFIFCFGITTFTQAQSSQYFGVNISSLLQPTLDIGYERNFGPQISTFLDAGYLFPTTDNSPHKKETFFDFENKSGVFLKLGAKFNFRKDINHFAPFVGANFTNGVAIERGFAYSPFGPAVEQVRKTSYNLGLNGLAGITSSSSSKFSFELGLQVGTLLIDNLVDYHSYMPGMGVVFPDPFYLQAILKLKYRIQ